MTRLSIICCAAVLAASVGYAVAGEQTPAGASQKVTVYKSPT